MVNNVSMTPPAPHDRVFHPCKVNEQTKSETLILKKGHRKHCQQRKRCFDGASNKVSPSQQNVLKVL